MNDQSRSQSYPNAGESLTPSKNVANQQKLVERKHRKAQRAAWLSIISWGTVIASVGGFFTLWHQIGTATSGTTSSLAGSSTSGSVGYGSSYGNGYSSGYSNGYGSTNGNGYGSSGYGSYSGYSGSASISPGSGSSFRSGAS